MNTTTQTFPTRERRASLAIAAAIIVSLGLGAVGGSVITRALDSGERTAVTPAAPGWDAQKVAAMQGRQRAEAIRLAAGAHP
jgi:hypothetical protein